MKRLVSVILVLVFTLSCTAVFAETGYSLRDKLINQLRLSTLRGAFVYEATGDADWVKGIAPFSGRNFSFRILSREDTLQAEAYVATEAGRLGETVLRSEDQAVYMKSDLLLDTVYSFPLRGDLLSTLLGIKGDTNPSLALGLLRMSTVQTDWSSIAAPYVTAMESWLDTYANEPVTVARNNETQMIFRHVIPVSDIKGLMKALIGTALNDQNISEQLVGNEKKQSQLTAEQQAFFYEKNLQWYYERVIDQLPLEGDITLERYVNTRGVERATRIAVPLVNAGEWEQLEIEHNELGDSYELTSSTRVISLTLNEARSGQDGGSWKGSLLITSQEQQPIAARFELLSVRTDTTDSDYVEHDITNWSFTATPDASQEDAVTFEPITAQVRVYYYGKPSQIDKTTLEVAMEIHALNGHLNGTARLASAAEWSAEPFNTSGAIDVTSLTEDQRQEILGDLISHASLLFGAPVEWTDEASAAVGTEEDGEDITVEDPNVIEQADTTTDEPDTAIDAATVTDLLPTVSEDENPPQEIISDEVELDPSEAEAQEVENLSEEEALTEEDAPVDEDDELMVEEIEIQLEDVPS